MADFLDDLKATPGANPLRPPRRDFHPSKEWEPRVDTEKGEIVVRTTDPDDSSVDWANHLRAWGFDPDKFQVEEPVEIRTWDAIPERGKVVTFYYYKARIRRKRPKADLEWLAKEIRSHRPRKTTPPDGDSTYVLCLSDWQLGKRDEGGTQMVVDRVLALIDSVLADVRRLRATGVDIGRLLFLGLGDLLEGCSGFYPAQTFTVELSGREQSHVAHRLVYKLLRVLAPEFPEVTVAAVGGNHGEKRQRGKAITDRGDNTDLEVFDNIAFRLRENPEVYGHVDFVIPDQDLAVTLEASGQWLGVTHGHLGRSGGTKYLPAGRVWEWWRGQAHGERPVGDTSLLVTGHYHHLSVVQQGPKTHIQVPPLDGGSDWFVDEAGYPSQPGTVTFVVTPEGWDHLRVH